MNAVSGAKPMQMAGPLAEQRVIVACSSCRKVKTACSDVKPCHRCIRMGMADTCVPALPGEHAKRKRRPKPSARSRRVEVLQPRVFPTSDPQPLFLEQKGEPTSTDLAPISYGPSPSVAALTFLYSIDDRDHFSTIHRLLSNPATRTESLIVGTSWLLHNCAQAADVYSQLLLAAHAQPQQSQRATLSPFSSSSSPQSPPSQRGSPSGDSPLTTTLSEVELQSHSSSSKPGSSSTALTSTSSIESKDYGAASIMAPLSLVFGGISESQHMLAFLLSQSTADNTLWDPLNSRSGSGQQFKALVLPTLTLPPIANDIDRQCYAFLNVWKNTPFIQQTLQRYFAWNLPLDMPLLLRSERVRSGSLPFGVIVYPLYPRPFSIYPHWVNQRFARMLGYEQDELNQLIVDCTFFWGLYYAEDRSLPNIYGRECMMTGKRRVTFQLRFVRKDGSVVPTITSAMFTYFDRLPIYVVLFIQEKPAIHRLTLFPKN